MRRIPTEVVWAVFFGAVVLASQVGAQAGAGGPQAAVLQINQQAMAMYGDLRFAEAKQLLQQAETMCNQYGVRGQPLARTYANIGIVEAGGLGNNAGALDFFRKALCQDRTVMLDPLSTTPDIQMLFNAAQGQVQAPGACAGTTAVAPVPQPPVYPQPTYPQPQPQTPAYPQPQTQPLPPTAAAQIMRHIPIAQQARMVPIPVFAEVNPNVTVGQIVLFYRTVGERIYQQVQMAKHTTGYAATIGCDVLTTLEPIGIEYYIAVLDPTSKLLGTAGTEAQPYQISIVDTLTVQPPSLPNEAPPSACVADCPPWNPDCNKSCKQLGDMCDNNGDCCSGMACIEEMCTASEDGGGGRDGGGDFKMHMRMSINAGTGFGLVTGGDAEPYNQVSPGKLKVGTGFAWSKFHIRVNPMFNIPKVEGLALGIMFRGDIPLETYDEKDAAASKGRDKPWALEPSLLASVSYRLVGSDDDTGFQLLFQGGLGWMNITHRVGYKDCNSMPADADGEYPNGFEYQEGELICNDLETDGSWSGDAGKTTHYFRKSGPFGIELGLDGYYWFVDNFGLNFGLILDAPLPKEFSLNIDVHAGIAFQF